MYIAAFPPCSCGGPRKWELLERYDRDYFELIYLRCLNCNCLSNLLFHEGGNAFCVPVRGNKDYVPFETVQLMAVDLLGFFQRNIERLNSLRGRLEQNVLEGTYKRFEFGDGVSLSRYQAGMQLALDRVFALLYISREWLVPPGYNPAPVPAEVPNHTLVYICTKYMGEDVWVRVKPSSFASSTPPNTK